MISGEESESLLLSEGGPSNVSSLLRIISLHCECQAAHCLPMNAFSLLSDLVTFLSEHEGFQDLRISALNCVTSVYPYCHPSDGSNSVPSTQSLTPHAARTPSWRINKTWEDVSVYEIALGERRSSPALTSESVARRKEIELLTGSH